MAKTKKVLSVILVVMLALTMLAGCSKKADPIVGKWSATEVAGTSLKDLGMTFTIEFKADGTVIVNTNGEEDTSTWEKKGDKYIVDGDENSNVTIADNVLTVNIEGSEIKFEKEAEK